MEKWEYQYGNILASYSEFNNRLNELGALGWEIKLHNKQESNELDPAGKKRYLFVVFMKRKKD